MTGWKRIARVLDGGPLSRRRRYLVVTALLAVGITLALLKPLLSARWSLIDDHETLAFYDASPSHGPGWFFRELYASGSLSPGEGSRYRPLYYFFRLAETGIWHGSARLWWLSHVLQFALFALLLLWAARRTAGIWENFAALVWMTGAITWWGDIWGRLGPSENYVALGLALYIWGAVAAVQTMRSGKLPRYHRWSGAALAIGGIVAAGTKENLVFLLLPSVYLVARARWRGSRRWITVGSALHLTFGIFVTIAIYVGVARNGHVYKVDASTGDRLSLMFAAFEGFIRGHVLVLAAAIAVSGGALFVAKEKRLVLARSLAMPAVTIIFSLLTWLSQVAFYDGWPPVTPRYYFPGALAAPLAVYACYVGAVRIARFFDVRAAIILRVLALVLMAWTLLHLDYSLHKQAALMRKNSSSFSSKLQRVVKAAIADPNAPIVIVSNRVMSYEPVDSLQIYLRHAHVKNPVYMVNRFASSDFPEGSLERSLAQEMETAARDGGKGLFPLTKPFAYQPNGGSCIGVGVDGGTGLKECRAVAIF
ncbi:MAG TPA: hypothetical protein VGM90_33130 [Kofleriaceae bacterium]